jgi:hypothetical protein
MGNGVLAIDASAPSRCSPCVWDFLLCPDSVTLVSPPRAACCPSLIIPYTRGGTPPRLPLSPSPSLALDLSPSPTQLPPLTCLFQTLYFIWTATTQLLRRRIRWVHVQGSAIPRHRATGASRQPPSMESVCVCVCVVALMSCKCLVPHQCVPFSSLHGPFALSNMWDIRLDQVRDQF